MTATQRVEIVRDEWGVPHVSAETELGALYGQGHVMAQDRPPTLVKAYLQAIGRMAEHFGIRAPVGPSEYDARWRGGNSEWGDVSRRKRGDRQWSVAAGVAGAQATVTVRALSGTWSQRDASCSIDFGQQCPFVVELKRDSIRSLSVVPFGQADDPESAHFRDQAEALFSRALLKDTHFHCDVRADKQSQRVVLEPNLPEYADQIAPADPAG